MEEPLSDQYKNLEQSVLANLRWLVKSSKEYSEHVQEKCIRVNVFNYTELVIINDRLTFLDDNGLQYSIWNGDCELEDFIDIIEQNKNKES